LVTTVFECTVPVGLFGLQKNTSPEPLEAASIAATSIRRLPSTGMFLTGVFIRLAWPSGLSHVGFAATSARVGDVNAATAPAMISPEPVPTRMLAGSTCSCFAMALESSPTLPG
jgi:hypothetical protein